MGAAARQDACPAGDLLHAPPHRPLCRFASRLAAASRFRFVRWTGGYIHVGRSPTAISSTDDSDRTPPEEPFVRVVDPAAGAGVFLTEVIDRVHATLVGQWSAAGHSEHQVRRQWNEYVATHLLPRISGVELQLPACVLATLLIAKRLSDTGYDFAKIGAHSHLPCRYAGRPAGATPIRSSRALLARNRGRRGRHAYAAGATVLLGNPPFSAISENSGVLDHRLDENIRGRSGRPVTMRSTDDRWQNVNTGFRTTMSSSSATRSGALSGAGAG